MRKSETNGLDYLEDVDIRSAKRDDGRRNPYAQGYGRKIPTCWLVLLPDMRWRRVYVAQYSNAGTAWVNYRGRMAVLGPDAEHRARCIIKTQS